MAQRPVPGQDASPPSSESARPSAPAHAESGYPSLQPAVVDPPVTPGIGVGAYEPSPESAANGTASYFPGGLDGAQESKAEPPSEAAPEPESDRDVLRRISLSGPTRQDSVDELDPRAAYPSLGLSGGIISATFCIPHSLRYTKGSEWVRSSFSLVILYADYF